MLALKCAGCGAMLDVAPTMGVFECSYCGVRQKVERSGSVVALRRTTEAVQYIASTMKKSLVATQETTAAVRETTTALRAVQKGTDRTASELAHQRLLKELDEVEEKRRRGLAAAAKGEFADGFDVLRISLGLFTVAMIWSSITLVVWAGWFLTVWLACSLIRNWWTAYAKKDDYERQVHKVADEERDRLSDLLKAQRKVIDAPLSH